MQLMPSAFTPGKVEVADPWYTWYPRPALAPQFSVTSEGLCITSTGENTCGCWERLLPALDPKMQYQVTVEYRTAGIAHEGKSIWALLVKKSDSDWKYTYDGVLQKAGDKEGWTILTTTLNGHEAAGVRLALYLSYSTGQVIWRRAEIREVPPAPARTVRVAAVGGSPAKQDSLEIKIRFLEEMAEKAGSFGVDLVCFPESVNSGGKNAAERGYEACVAALAEKARRHSMYICAGLHQDVGDTLYNVAVFLDPQGQVIGTYRKTHPTIQECLYKGIKPGDTYPVFDTAIGRLAALICWDYHYPEVTRLLALQGADIICLPNAGEGREKGCFWESILRTRAIDNQVHIVAAVNGGRAMIVSPAGYILASSGKTKPGLAVAELNLSETMVNSAGQKVKGVYDKARRADTYGLLARHIWD